MIDLLIAHPILLLVVVSALGYLLGQVRIKGSSLGVAAVLFAGLGVGALHPDLKLPEFTTLLGLVLFVYAVGLSSGPGFFAALRRKGLRDNLLVVGVLLGAFGLALAAYAVFRLDGATVAGMFAGSLTNTPALAAVLEFLGEGRPALRDAAVVGYSIAYPMGVVGMILAIVLMQHLWKVDYAAEAEQMRGEAVGQDLHSYSIRVEREGLAPLEVLAEQEGWDVLFGRVKRADGTYELAEGTTRLQPGDLVSVVATQDEAERVQQALGRWADEHLEQDRRVFDFRRIFVSNPNVAGRRVRDLAFLRQYDAIVTRVRRGDVEWLVHGDTVLELGDRVRVVARPEVMGTISRLFGDSYRALSEINLLTLSLGLLAGLLIGMIPVPLPGDVTFRLGLAGGPLVVGLVLGRVGRTGPLLWYLPYSANLLLRQLGLVLFFAGVGTRAGYAFFDTLSQGGGLLIFGAGAIITCTVALAVLVIGHRVLRIPMGVMTGMLAGLQTQPAVLSFALEQTGNDLPNVGYATVFPVATITKIILAQVLLSLLL
ncbi:MAG: transporter [Bacteroidetes bacterium]|nr:MAG: transporter [Bacteroidota bacterium]